MTLRKFVFLAFASLILCFSSANADSTPISQILGPPFLNSTSADPTDPNNCSTKHSGDYYGIGVRLGIYMVWLQSYLANTFVPEEISGAFDANTIFLLALLAAIFRGTLERGPDRLVKVDGLILMHLSAGYMFGCLSIWGYRTIHYQNEGPAGVRHFGRFGTHARLALAFAISSYGVWFWTMGILKGHGLASLTDVHGNRREECYPLKTFFFAKLDVTGGIRYYYIVVTICCTLYYGFMLCIAAMERAKYFLKKVSSRSEVPHVVYETGLNKKQLDRIYIFLRVGNFVWMVFAAVMVELSLIWNNVKDVVGPNGQIAFPSQLLPMLIGALTLVRMLWIIFNMKREEWKVRHGRTTESQESESSEQSKEELGNTGQAQPVRPFYIRCLIAWLPWLSQFRIWTRYNNSGHGESLPYHQDSKTDPSNRDSTAPMLAQTPNTPYSPFKDSHGVSSAVSPVNSPMINFSPTEKSAPA